MQNQPRTEFAQALRAIATERDLDPEVILDAVKQAIIAAFRRDAKDRGEDDEEMEYIAELDPSSGEASIFSFKEGKEDKKKNVTPPGFGRIAAQTAKQVIHQKIREAEKGVIMDEYSLKVGGLVSGTVLRFDGPNVRVDLGKSEGVMPASERVPVEHLRPNQRLTFLLKEIMETPRGKELILSRSDPNFVIKLFAREVPEMASNNVEVRGIARDPGVRTKIAVYSSQSGVDPVGSCVGQKGVRVQVVTNELGGERVDIVSFTEDDAEYIKSAMAPAEGLSVKLDKKNKIATVFAPTEMLSIAIGKDGQNARLTGELTGWKVTVEEIITKGAKEKVEEQEKTKKAKEESTLGGVVQTEVEEKVKKVVNNAAEVSESGVKSTPVSESDVTGKVGNQ